MLERTQLSADAGRGKMWMSRDCVLMRGCAKVHEQHERNTLLEETLQLDSTLAKPIFTHPRILHKAWHHLFTHTHTHALTSTMRCRMGRDRRQSGNRWVSWGRNNHHVGLCGVFGTSEGWGKIWVKGILGLV